MQKMSSYDRDMKARANRVAQGETILVKVAELVPGMLIHDFSLRFARNETIVTSDGSRNTVKFLEGSGFSEGLETVVEVMTEPNFKADLYKNLVTSPCDGACVADIGDCYIGQWTVHAPHHFEVHLQKWQGGGKVQRHCTGRSQVTRLR